VRSSHQKAYQLTEEDITTNSAIGLLSSLLKDDSGQDLIEYALVAGLIGLGAVVAMSSLAASIGSSFNTVGSSLTSAT